MLLSLLLQLLRPLPLLLLLWGATNNSNNIQVELLFVRALGKAVSSSYCLQVFAFD
jgi:hypothetical protein